MSSARRNQIFTRIIEVMETVPHAEKFSEVVRHMLAAGIAQLGDDLFGAIDEIWGVLGQWNKTNALDERLKEIEKRIHQIEAAIEQRGMLSSYRRDVTDLDGPTGLTGPPGQLV